MKIELICVICKASLAISEIKSENCVLLSNACVQIESPFCKDCANVYMYSNGTMKEEIDEIGNMAIDPVSLQLVSFSNHESQLG
jgi:hypothetical protein